MFIHRGRFHGQWVRRYGVLLACVRVCLAAAVCVAAPCLKPFISPFGIYIFRGVKDSEPRLVWMWECPAGMDTHKLAVLLGATCTIHENTMVFSHIHLRSEQRTRALLSHSIDRP